MDKGGRGVPRPHMGLLGLNKTYQCLVLISSLQKLSMSPSHLGLGHLCLVPKTNFLPNCEGHIKKSARDDVRGRTLSRFRSFKITNFDTNRKPVCHFKVNNTKVGRHPIWSHTIFHLSRSICQIIAFDNRTPLVNTLTFSAISLNICISHILSKTRFIVPHFPHRHYGSTFNHFDVVAFKI